MTSNGTAATDMFNVTVYRRKQKQQKYITVSCNNINKFTAKFDV